MKELQFGEKKVPITASAPALLYYRQEFGADLIGDMTKMISDYDTGGDQEENPEVNPVATTSDALALGNINFLSFLQLAWAMAKAYQYGKPFPKFETWLNDYGEDIDFSDEGFIIDIVEEATTGFFRQNQGVKGAFAGRRK
ncbi:hypothetical protein JNUCC31_25135 [Paenibacillus sp. JNUCC31]|uniref:hypothetical protein n=1 Tax=Paenibacillus sp. JNUCC-31 TaxID=2777983 RepID=UPI00178119DF|nr:hypothetical protein [Paenibacillus sp. JNUCC-31]QOS77951.1 hypothetical protein JNUCC31_24895 [Paenibacillus sp. JNUCC-31]QOS77994.1 hypothetical protein JNUCC31_25135 [Paenibacillus sp. JNUCC-31]